MKIEKVEEFWMDNMGMKDVNGGVGIRKCGFVREYEVRKFLYCGYLGSTMVMIDNGCRIKCAFAFRLILILAKYRNSLFMKF